MSDRIHITRRTPVADLNAFVDKAANPRYNKKNSRLYDAPKLEVFVDKILGRAKHRAEATRAGIHGYIGQVAAGGRTTPQPKGIKSLSAFMSNKEVAGSSGGQTGSKRVKKEFNSKGKPVHQSYQLKSSIVAEPEGPARMSFGAFKAAVARGFRRAKARGLETENYGEFIGSRIAKAAVGKQNADLVPKVKLLTDSVRHQDSIASKYVARSLGPLDMVFEADAGPLPKGQKHVHVMIGTGPGPTTTHGEAGTMVLRGDAAKDMARNIALSALLADHDMNPGNMIGTGSGDLSGLRIARIDLGHAFNDLITQPFAKKVGGGLPVGNRILDFFNRETVCGNPFLSSSGGSKLWRDYSQTVITSEMVGGLRELAAGKDWQKGVEEAKAEFLLLAGNLENEIKVTGSPDARKHLDRLTASLARIGANLDGEPIEGVRGAEALVNAVFRKISGFMDQGQKDMKHVADLCQLQVDIDRILSTPVDQRMNAKGRDGKDVSLDGDIHESRLQMASQAFEKLAGGSGKPITWLKFDKDEPAFTGGFYEYMEKRERFLDSMKGAEASSKAHQIHA